MPTLLAEMGYLIDESAFDGRNPSRTRCVSRGQRPVASATRLGEASGSRCERDATSEPAYWVGHCLVVLWCARCGCQLEDVPIKHVPLSISAIMKSFD